MRWNYVDAMSTDHQMNVRWGLIGCGDIARKRVAAALRDTKHSELVAVNRAQADLAEAFAKEFGARKWYGDWRELLTDKDIDAIYVATPVHLHATQTIQAAEAGKHVLCEKPMAMNPLECEQMMAASRANHVKLGIAYYRHFYPVINRIKTVISQGEIGQPVLAQINAYEWFNPRLGEARSWLTEFELAGGGPMFDFGCHRIEVLSNLFGPIQRTVAITTRAAFTREVEDTAAAVFKFERGMCATLAVSHAVREPQDTLDIYGSHGSIHVPVLNAGKLQITNGVGVREESHPAAENIHQPLIDDFIDAVLMDREPRVGGEIGKLVAEIEEEIYNH
jgi:predicted dehydrogenase